jgi:hypothetical protein
MEPITKVSKPCLWTPTFLQIDDKSLDDEKNQEVKVNELGVIDICGFMTMNARTPPI